MTMHTLPQSVLMYWTLTFSGLDLRSALLISMLSAPQLLTLNRTNRKLIFPSGAYVMMYIQNILVHKILWKDKTVVPKPYTVFFF